MYDEDYGGYREDPFFQQVVRTELRSVFLSRKQGGRILDVGCGNGAFLAEARDIGYEVMGIDTSEAAVRLTEQRQIPSVAGDFIKTEFHDLFDFITMWDVIEHLADPRAFVERALELLLPGQQMRSKRPLKSIRSVAGRVLRFGVGLLSGNTNLYVLAKK